MTDRLAVSSLRKHSLLLLGIIPALLLMAGYVGLTVVFFLPLLGLRRVFRRRSAPAVDDAPHHSGVGTGRGDRQGMAISGPFEVLTQPEEGAS